MAFDDQLVLSVLVMVDAIIYILLAVGVLRRRKSKQVVSNISDVFRILEEALRENYPSLPVGFTWREALSMLKQSKPEINWEQVEAALENYEAHKYGGVQLANVSSKELLRLAALLGIGARFVNES